MQFFHLHRALKLVQALVTRKKALDFFQKCGITKVELEKLHSADYQFGIISAYRSELSRNENKRRHTELIQYLNSRGYKWEVTQGAWGTPEGYALENSILVYAVDLDDLIMLGDYYGQEAIIFKEAGEPVGLYDLEKRTAVFMTEKSTDMQAPRPRVKEEQGIEHEISTRWRDVELVYEFDFEHEVPFGEAHA